MNITRVSAVAVSLSILLTCPGLAPYAAAQTIRTTPATSAPTAGAQAGVPVMSLGGSPFSVPSLMSNALGLNPALVAPSAPAPLPAPAVVSALAPALSMNASAVSVAAAKPAAAAVPTVAAQAAVAAKAVEAAAALESAGPVAKASASSASGLGSRLEEILTGNFALRPSAELSAPAAGSMGAFEDSHQLARPAGDSIREAAAATASDDGVPPAPSANRPAPRGPAGPFWPRLLSAGLALAPAILLGLPLLSASAYLVGGLVIASSLTLAVMPFLGESSPKLLRAAPGVALIALGLSAAGVSASLTFGLGVAVAPALGWMGALALLGGWGLTRYGLGKSEGRYGSYGSIETLSAFFGGLAAVTGVALAASTPLGWIGTGILWVAYPVSALLWFHLPGWVGKGMTAAVEGLWHGVKGLSRVLTSIHRDTVLLDRLQKFSERHWKSSKWNAVWLAVIWTPILLVEAAMYVLSAAGGLIVGAVAAPVNFLWGASAKLWPGSKANVYFAEAARFVFDNVQNGKVKRWNPIAAKLIPYANSPKLIVSAGGAIALRLAQAGWLVYSLIGAPILSVAGLIAAFGRTGAYDEQRHKPSRARVSTDDNASEKPSEPDQPEPGAPGKNPLLPKLIASALALVPAVYFGLPILAGGSFIQIPLFAALAIPLALMPFLGKAPLWAKSFAGKALFYNGLILLLNGNAILVGLVAWLGGWGFGRWVKKTSASNGSFDEAELGAFFAALASTAAVGAVWAGVVSGWLAWGTLALAAATSPFLLIHLPEYVFKGVREVVRHFVESVSDYADVLASWSDDTDFRRNLGKHADYWLKKTYWNGVWLSVIWVPTGLVMAAQYVLSAALGIVSAAIRAPMAFAAGAFAEAKPGTRRAKFFAAWQKAWRAEDSKALYDKLTGWLKPALAESSPVTGRPTLKAAGALIVHQLITLGWLIGVLALNVTGLSFVWGLIQAVRAALSR